MELNKSKCLTFLKESTLNHSIPTIHISVKADSITSKMFSQIKDVITLISITPNDIVTDVKEPFELYFNEPTQSLVPFLNMIEGETCKFEFKENHIVLKEGKQRSKIHLCTPNLVTCLNSSDPKTTFKSLGDFVLDEAMTASFEKIKKLAAKFNKVYFGIESNVCYVETSDKTNTFSNGLRIELFDSEHDDMVLTFDSKNFVNALAVMKGNNFSGKIFDLQQKSNGILYFYAENLSKQFFLMSKKDS